MNIDFTKILPVLLIIQGYSSFSQDRSIGDKTESTVYQYVDESAYYPYGMDSLYQNLNVVYPQRAQMDSIQGRVFIQFVVEKDGMLTNFKVLRGLNRECDMAALEGVERLSQLDYWVPGKIDGVPVRQLHIIPVSFEVVNPD